MGLIFQIFLGAVAAIMIGMVGAFLHLVIVVLNRHNRKP